MYFSILTTVFSIRFIYLLYLYKIMCVEGDLYFNVMIAHTYASIILHPYIMTLYAKIFSIL